MSEEEKTMLLSAIDQICEAHREGIKGIHLAIEANALVMGKDIKETKDHLYKLNGSVAELRRESDARQLIVAEFRQHQKFGKWIHKNWWASALIFIGAVIAIFEVWNRFSLKEILSFFIATS